MRATPEGPASLETRAAAGPRPVALLAVVFLIATSGLVYELVAGALASYLLGDSVTQFSLVIGVYLSSLGLGAYVSKFVARGAARVFVDVELATALVGGASAPVLLLAFAHAGSFHLVLWPVVATTGVLVGLELPLLMRLLGDRLEFKDLVAKALFFDYLGALVASVLFALVLVPALGLVRTSLLFGLVNALVGLASTWLLGASLSVGEARAARVRGLVVVAALVALFVSAERLTRAAEVAFYGEPVLGAEQSAYQRIVMTQGRGGISLYLNNNLQFSSSDERRYHEALVHPAFAASRPGTLRDVLVVGGGDGLAMREILTYPEVARALLVDLDPAMTRLGSRDPRVVSLNGGSLSAPRVRVVNDDAMTYLEAHPGAFDLIVVDFPDPNNLALGKLYTTRFYRVAAEHLAPGGRLVVQATSPFFSRRSFWCVVTTIEAAGLTALPYHAFVPSFGEWGYVLAARSPLAPPTALRALMPLASLDDRLLVDLFHFAPDIARVPAPVNRLDNQALVAIYEAEIGRYASP